MVETDVHEIDCEWQPRGGSSFRCGRCELIIINTAGESAQEFLAKQPPCGLTMTQMTESSKQRRIREFYAKRHAGRPPVSRKVVSYAKAMARWIKAGRPVRSDAEVERIFDTICKPCQDFNSRGSCGICGCKVRRRGSALLNKIRQATQSCPKSKW